jgi:hypothetical protein
VAGRFRKCSRDLDEFIGCWLPFEPISTGKYGPKRAYYYACV